MELVSAAHIAVIGEGMLELTLQDGAWRVGTAGDALNVATHLARFGRQVDFITALGADPISVHLRAAWAAEGIGVGHVLSRQLAAVGGSGAVESRPGMGTCVTITVPRRPQ